MPIDIQAIYRDSADNTKIIVRGRAAAAPDSVTLEQQPSGPTQTCSNTHFDNHSKTWYCEFTGTDPTKSYLAQATRGGKHDSANLYGTMANGWAVQTVEKASGVGSRLGGQAHGTMDLVVIGKPRQEDKGAARVRVELILLGGATPPTPSPFVEVECWLCRTDPGDGSWWCVFEGVPADTKYVLRLSDAGDIAAASSSDVVA